MRTFIHHRSSSLVAPPLACALLDAGFEAVDSPDEATLVVHALDADLTWAQAVEAMKGSSAMHVAMALEGREALGAWTGPHGLTIPTQPPVKARMFFLESEGFGTPVISSWQVAIVANRPIPVPVRVTGPAAPVSSTGRFVGWDASALRGRGVAVDPEQPQVLRDRLAHGRGEMVFWHPLFPGRIPASMASYQGPSGPVQGIPMQDMDGELRILQVQDLVDLIWDRRVPNPPQSPTELRRSLPFPFAACLAGWWASILK